MGSAIWSTPPGLMLDFPARSFLRFCVNHSLLHVSGRPKWRSAGGGSHTYVDAAARSVSGATRVSAPVSRVERRSDGVWITRPEGMGRYDSVVLACHADQTLDLLADPAPAEGEILGALGSNPNDVVLHTDTSFLP